MCVFFDAAGGNHGEEHGLSSVGAGFEEVDFGPDFFCAILVRCRGLFLFAQYGPCRFARKRTPAKPCARGVRAGGAKRFRPGIFLSW